MPSEWYNAATETIEKLKQTLPPRESKEYRLDKLGAIARRIDEFALSDSVCAGYQKTVDEMLAELPGAPLPYARNKIYICTIGTMTNHLKKAHRLVSEGEYLGLGLVVGLILGMAVGLIIGNTQLAAIAGLVLGLIAGLSLDAQAKRNGRII